jgi:hypothetical protein
MRNKTRHLTGKCLSIIILLNIYFASFSQVTDSLKVVNHFNGVITITNKGISTIPNLTLGKPAAIFAFSIGRRFSAEPEIRMALEGKPWMIIFWWRYEILNNDKFLIKVRTNQTVAFKDFSDTTSAGINNYMIGQRTLTSDFTANYFITKNITIGPYYMYIYGIEKNVVKNTHYIALKAGFSNIRLSENLLFRISPQIYYLKMDEKDGFYFNTGLNLSRQNFPLSVSALLSKSIKTEIPVGRAFLWNVSLVYTFNKKYVEE